MRFADCDNVLVARLEGLIKKNAWQFATGAVDPEDLISEQVAKILELQASEHVTKPHFMQLVISSCRNVCIDLYRKEKVRGGLYSLDDPDKAESVEAADRGFEAYREKLEFNERVAMLKGLDKAVALEILSPSPGTLAAEREEEDSLFEMLLEGKTVRNRAGIDQTARRIARGLRVPYTDVKRSCRNLKAYFAN